MNMKPEKIKTDFVAFRLDADLHQKLKAQARGLRVSKSFLMKQYLLRGMGFSTPLISSKPLQSKTLKEIQE